jgi:hypothetical protein
MFFTLAVSAATPQRCAELVRRAAAADPSVLPVPGPAVTAWCSPDGRAALLHWAAPGDGDSPGQPDGGAASAAGTIWAGRFPAGAGGGPSTVGARTTLTRIDPVYLAELPDAVVLADRATWAAWTVSRLDDHDPRLLCALLGPGYPLGPVTPFRGVSALPPSSALRMDGGRAVLQPGSGPQAGREQAGLRAGARDVAAALVAAVAPMREAGRPVELSLTGGKDSRLIAAALVTAGVPVTAHTHGFADHPDVVVAAEVARRLGVEHVVRVPAAPGQQVDVLTRIRATVLVADGMLSAFENVGRPDPARSPALSAGGHGGELLRGGYAETAGRRGARSGLRGALSPARQVARSAELLRRLTTRHLGLVRRGPAAGYLASLVPWTAALSRSPLRALDDFYLINRAGRWSAAARQAYLLRERLVQPLFDDRVVLAARAVPLTDRISGALSAAVLAELSPALADVPLAGKPDPALAPFDWRRQYGEAVATLLREYILDSGGLFDVVSRPAAEKLLVPPHTDRPAVWSLATLACLTSGDYRNAREATPWLPVA